MVSSIETLCRPTAPTLGFSPASTLCFPSFMPNALRSMCLFNVHDTRNSSGTSNELSTSIPRSILARARGRGARDAAEHRTRGQAGTAGIVEVKQSAHQFAGGIEAADRLVVGIEHLGIGGDAHAAEGKGEAAGDRVAFERRLIDGVRPIA